MSFKSRLGNWTMYLSLVAIPLGSPKGWENLRYRGITPNVVEFGSEKLVVHVKNSASPLIYVLLKKHKVGGLQVTGEWQGTFNVKKENPQGEKNFDDFVLRLGLIVPGPHTPGMIERMMAPEWLKKLFDLAPKGQGIERVEFYNAVVSPQALGIKRHHPLHNLILENYSWELSKPTSFSFAQKWPKPTEVLGVWVSADGDDTKSEFDLRLSKLVLELVD